MGQRLLEARQQAGLSQAQVAAKMNIPQQTYAGWERTTNAVKPEHIARLAVILAVPVEFLLGHDKPLKAPRAPRGKMRRLFEEASQLPRSRQQRILAVLEDMIAAQQLATKEGND